MNSKSHMVLFLLVFISERTEHKLIQVKNGLRDVAENKPIMIHSRNGPKSTEAFIKRNHFTLEDCLHINTRDSIVVTLDLWETYPILKIRLLMNQHIVSNDEVKLLINSKRYCTNHLTKGRRYTDCDTNAIGRTIRVEFNVKTGICFLGFKVFVCKEGLQGSKCSKHCDNGSYGIACIRKCSCKDEREHCNDVDGHCKSGCSTSITRSHNCYILSSQEGNSKSNYKTYEDFSWTIVSNTKNVHHTIETFTEMETPETHIQGYSNTSLHSHQSNEKCFELSSSKASSSVWLEFQHTDEQMVHGVQCRLKSSTQLNNGVVTLSIDSRVCHASPINISTRLDQKLNIHCLPVPKSGRTLRLTIQADFLQRPKIKICGWSPLVCAHGAYGPHCQMTCSCYSGNCHPATGQCIGYATCFRRLSGKSCGAIDLTHRHLSKVYSYQHWPKRRPRPRRSRFTKSSTKRFKPAAYLDPASGSWISWMALRMDGVYPVTGVSFTPREYLVNHHRKFTVYLDNRASKRFRPMQSYQPVDLSGPLGLPCVLYKKDPPSRVIEAPCLGFARTVTLVVSGSDNGVSAALEDFTVGLNVWTCLDGTFGPGCHQLCNCRYATDQCDKTTGHCARGCADGYTGLNCKKRCHYTSLDPECNTGNPCYCREESECQEDPLVCPSGCKTGYWSTGCFLACRRGFFGPDCLLRCADCLNMTVEDCDRFLEDCPNRIEDLVEGALSKTNSIPGFVFALGLVAVVLVCVCLIRYTCSRSQKNNEERKIDAYMKRMLSETVGQQMIASSRRSHEERIKERARLRMLEHQKSSVTIEEGDREPQRKEYTVGRVVQQLAKHDGDKAEPENMTLLNVAHGLDEHGRCAPLRNNKEQDAFSKVAVWIMGENFEELINIQKDRIGNVDDGFLDIEEFGPERSFTSINTTEIDRLYDDIDRLQIP